MTGLTNLVISAIVAVSIALIALLSVQNATLVSVKFLNFHSIDLPWGLVLAILTGVGWILGGCLPWLGTEDRRRKR